jgi:hypothetical protein
MFVPVPATRHSRHGTLMLPYPFANVSGIISSLMHQTVGFTSGVVLLWLLWHSIICSLLRWWNSCIDIFLLNLLQGNVRRTSPAACSSLVKGLGQRRNVGPKAIRQCLCESVEAAEEIAKAAVTMASQGKQTFRLLSTKHLMMPRPESFWDLVKRMPWCGVGGEGECSICSLWPELVRHTPC